MNDKAYWWFAFLSITLGACLLLGADLSGPTVKWNLVIQKEYVTHAGSRAGAGAWTVDSNGYFITWELA